MPKLDDAYREQMTAEEIAAFEAEDEESAAEALDALANPETEADPEEAEDAAKNAAANDTPPTGEDDAKGENGEDDTKTAAEDDPAPKAQEDPPKEEPKPEPVPDVEAAQKTLDTVKLKRKELRNQYDDGDLTDDEYDGKMEELDDAAANAAADIKTAERHVARQREQWKAAGTAYLERYPGLKADGVIQALDQTVQDLARYPSVANLPHDQFLERVHRKLIADAEFTGLDIPAIEKSGKKAEKTAPEGDESLGKAPRTLASVPSSDVSNLDDSPFASLERLAQKGDPIAFEEAMAKLPADKRDQFASMYIE